LILQKSKSDWNGNLNNWWTSEDSIAFRKLTQQLVKQFNGFNAIDSSFVNGQLTLGENIADLGGLTLAFEALKKQYNGNPPAPIDGFTWQQRFYLGWANVWKGNIRDEELRNRLMTDSHSPARFRVLGPLENLPTFYEAYHCEMDSSLTPIKIW
jgi:putative endopeptidase